MTPEERKAITTVLVRPWLWASAWRFKPNKGFRPPKEYVEFRMETMYGDKDHQPSVAEVVTFLNWCRRFTKESKRSAREKRKQLDALLTVHYTGTAFGRKRMRSKCPCQRCSGGVA